MIDLNIEHYDKDLKIEGIWSLENGKCSPLIFLLCLLFARKNVLHDKIWDTIVMEEQML